MWQHSGEGSGPKARLDGTLFVGLQQCVFVPELSSSSGTGQSSDHVTCAHGICTSFDCCGVLFELTSIRVSVQILTVRSVVFSLF